MWYLVFMTNIETRRVDWGIMGAAFQKMQLKPRKRINGTCMYECHSSSNLWILRCVLTFSERTAATCLQDLTEIGSFKALCNMYRINNNFVWIKASCHFFHSQCSTLSEIFYFRFGYQIVLEKREWETHAHIHACAHTNTHNLNCIEKQNLHFNILLRCWIRKWTFQNFVWFARF